MLRDASQLRSTWRHLLRPRRIQMNGAHPIVDSIVQVCTVELFRAYQLPVAPMGGALAITHRRRDAEIIGVITFSAGEVRGRLMLEVPSTILALSNPAGTHFAKGRDWAQELTNQLMGRIKNRLLRLRVELTLGVPFVMDRRHCDAVRLAPDAARYDCLTTRGELQVVLEGKLDESGFSYTGEQEVGSEGDIILF
jgi:hypothetical protein